MTVSAVNEGNWDRGPTKNIVCLRGYGDSEEKIRVRFSYTIMLKLLLFVILLKTLLSIKPLYLFLHTIFIVKIAFTCVKLLLRTGKESCGSGNWAKHKCSYIQWCHSVLKIIIRIKFLFFVYVFLFFLFFLLNIQDHTPTEVMFSGSYFVSVEELRKKPSVISKAFKSKDPTLSTGATDTTDPTVSHFNVFELSVPGVL